MTLHKSICRIFPENLEAGHPSWVIYALRAAALRRLRSETRLRAQSRAHPSLPLQKTYHFINSLRPNTP